MQKTDIYSRRSFIKAAGLAACCVLSSSCCSNAAQPDVPLLKCWLETGPKVPQLDSFDSAMKEFMQARSIPGGSLAVTCQQRLVFARGYTGLDDGYIVQPDSLFRIASVSKPVTAAAVMTLVQSGQLSLDAKMVEMLPKELLSLKYKDTRTQNITIRHLLQHLGGWNRLETLAPMFYDRHIADSLNVSLPLSKIDIVKYMADKPLQYDPGTTRSYNNYGYMLLGLIIEAVTGQSYDDYVKSSIFKPLGITRPVIGRSLLEYRQPNEVKYYSCDSKKQSVFDKKLDNVPFQYGGFNIENMAAHGGWITSAIDLVRFAAAFDNPDQCPILSKPAIDTMFGLPANIAPDRYKPGDGYYGCGWSVRDWHNGNRNTWHGGSLPGTHTLLIRRWKDNLNWCVLFNQRDDSSGLNYGDIDGMLHDAANSVKQWPDHDLFSQYLSPA